MVLPEGKNRPFDNLTTISDNSFGSWIAIWIKTGKKGAYF
jgi:hypothetical protein